MLTRDNVLKELSIKSSNGFYFNELPNIPKINLRGNSNDKQFIFNINNILNILLPLTPNTFNQNNSLKTIWLGPNEWLIEINQIRDFEKIFLDLKETLNFQNTAVTDVTENRTILKLSGIYLYKLLAKFMVVDLEKVLKSESSVAQTIFVKIPVLIIRNHNKNQEPSVYLHANRSHAQYIYNLIVDGSHYLDF